MQQKKWFKVFVYVMLLALIGSVIFTLVQPFL
ncbi:stressosome-associated protein Prli42 [Paenibacillus campi]|nr:MULTISPECIES: stressosome-associated protein Prli42 [unclassified Paenibacillus]